MLHEVDEHRLERTSEDPLQERVALPVHTHFLRKEGEIKVGAAFSLEAERSLFHQASDERLGGFGVPRRVILLEGLKNFSGAERGLSPEDLHDLPFRFRDAGGDFHGC